MPKPKGGGLRGSIITTLLLIGLTLIIALPIGVLLLFIYMNWHRKIK